jgi:BMFP domain-containing protein YqiC
MARVTKDTLTAQVTALEAKVAALEAKLALARECWTNQRAQIGELEAKLAARGRFVDATPAGVTPAGVTPARAAYLARQAAKPAYVPLHERSPEMAALRDAAMARGKARAMADEAV